MTCVENFNRGVSPSDALFVAIPNGEERPGRAAERLIAEGLHPGALDAVLVLPRGRVVWCEFKVEADPIRDQKRTYPSKNQRTFMSRLTHLAHDWVIIRTPEEWQALLDREGVRNRVRLW